MPPHDPTEPIARIEGGVRVRVRVQPRASRTAVQATPEGRIRASLTAPPVEGEANAALCEAMARALGVPKSSVTIASGLRGREKSVHVIGVSVREARDRLGVGAPTKSK